MTDQLAAGEPMSDLHARLLGKAEEYRAVALFLPAGSFERDRCLEDVDLLLEAAEAIGAAVLAEIDERGAA